MANGERFITPELKTFEDKALAANDRALAAEKRLFEELLQKLAPALDAFRKAGAALAELELKGRAEGTADLEITGRLNPLVQPLALDIRGRMRDLELPPLSPSSLLQQPPAAAA